jgi:hypothetical protein
MTATKAFPDGKPGKPREALVKTGWLMVAYASYSLPARASLRKFDDSLKDEIA